MGGVLVDTGRRGRTEKRVRILPDFKGRGLGRLLIQAIEARASGLGAHSIFADTTVQQVGAQRLYISAGYHCLKIMSRGIYRAPISKAHRGSDLSRSATRPA